MKRILLVVFALLLTTIGSVWAGPYELVMSKNKKFCKAMLVLYNEDVNSYRYGEIKYDTHEIFTRISWQPVDLNEKEHPTYGCSFVKQALFDIDNDGKNDLVIKYSGCLRDDLTDSLFVFAPDSDILSKLKPGLGGLAPLFKTLNKINRNTYDLKELPKSVEEKLVTKIRKQLPESSKNLDIKIGIGGVFILQPFIWDTTSYISMTDLHQEWIVVAKYKQAEEMQDICYFHGPDFYKR